MSEGVYTEGREGHGHIKSYVRRAGRMSEAQARYYAELMPKIGVAYTPQPIDLAAVYGRNARKILEIAFGLGAPTTITLASKSMCRALARCASRSPNAA